MSEVAIHSEVWVCDECMLVHANGEGSPSRPEDYPVAWSLWSREMGIIVNMAMGGTHSEHCPNNGKASGHDECDCETNEFSMSSCDGCGDRFHGRRHLFTVFYVYPIPNDPRHWEIYDEGHYVFSRIHVILKQDTDVDSWVVRYGGADIAEFPEFKDAAGRAVDVRQV